MAADSPPWPSSLKLGMNLVAAHYATSFRTVHIRVLPYLDFKVLIGYWSLFSAILAITRTYPPSVGEAGLLSTSLYQRRQRCYQSPWSDELTPIRALMKQWSTLPELPKFLLFWSSSLFPFHVALFKVKGLLRARSSTKTSVSPECITHAIPARVLQA